MIGKKIIELLKAGDRSAFRQVVEGNIDQSYSLAFRMLGDHEESNDIVQESFIKIWEKRAGIRTEGAIEPWIRRIVINKCYDRLRKRKRNSHLLNNMRVNEIDNLISEETADGKLREEEYARIMEALTSKLSPKQRLVFILSEIEGMSHDEIGRSTGLSKNSIKSNISHARGHLKKIINELMN